MKLNVAASMILALTLTACMDTPNGELPSQFLPQYQSYAGTYNGFFWGQWGTLTLSLEGNRPKLGYVSKDGSQDLLGFTLCGSRIGALESIEDSGNQVQVMEFAFDPGQCDRVQIGEHKIWIELEPEKNGRKQITVAVMGKGDWSTVDNPHICDVSPGWPGPCFVSPDAKDFVRSVFTQGPALYAPTLGDDGVVSY